MTELGADRAHGIRAEFDEAFAAPPRPVSAVENVLLISVADQPYAVRVTEIAGLLAGRKIVPVGTAEPMFLGLIGYRSVLIPVYDLATILRLPPPLDPPRWIFLARRPELMAGFAVQRVDGQLQLPAEQLIAADPLDHPGPTIGHLLRTDDSVRPVLRISALVDTIVRSIAKE